MKKYFILTVLLFVFTISLSAQETLITSDNSGLYKGNKTNDRNNVSGMPKVVTKTQKQTDLENQIKSINSLLSYFFSMSKIKHADEKIDTRGYKDKGTGF